LTDMVPQRVYDSLYMESCKIHLKQLENEKFEDVWKPVKESMYEIKYLTDEKNITVLFLIVNIPEWDYSKYDLAAIQTANNYGWMVIDMGNVYRNYDQSLLVISKTDSHPSIFAHKLIAEQIYKKLENFIPK